MTGPFNLRLRIKPDRAAAIAVSLAPALYFLPALLRGRALCPLRWSASEGPISRWRSDDSFRMVVEVLPNVGSYTGNDDDGFVPRGVLHRMVDC
jgi:hypothetical protein